MILLAIDPGKRTGIAEYWDSERGAAYWRLSTHNFDELPAAFNRAGERGWPGCWCPTLVLVEDYVPQPWRGYMPKGARESAERVRTVVSLCRKQGWPVELVTSEALNTFSDDDMTKLLKAEGFTKRTSHHARAAARHVHIYLSKARREGVKMCRT